ncbi:hypothetical protein BC936DRAFT_149351 [Jimgerdemannia flammicorona]|uniref:Uncharacterized protein n=1 Tax=Jimgerdemannia flammicorona TaxID=994334 RepID=A0A433D0Z9_9FUNG|nr:hypothetical protein BC936DRAFT_149351 [Jimgerdemannia flammicorona]
MERKTKKEKHFCRAKVSITPLLPPCPARLPGLCWSCGRTWTFGTRRNCGCCNMCVCFVGYGQALTVTCKPSSVIVSLERKKEFEERIKSRGKRKKTAADVSEDGAEEGEEGEEHRPKRAKDADDDGEPLDPKASAYLKEMQTYNERHVGDERRSRPLVK